MIIMDQVVKHKLVDEFERIRDRSGDPAWDLLLESYYWLLDGQGERALKAIKRISTKPKRRAIL